MWAIALRSVGRFLIRTAYQAVPVLLPSAATYIGYKIGQLDNEAQDEREFQKRKNEMELKEREIRLKEQELEVEKKKRDLQTSK